MFLRTILLIDDHPLVREGLTAVINREPDLQVCASVETLREARLVLADVTPDLIVTDLTLPDGSGLEFVKDVRAQHPKLPILVVSMHDETIYAERALHAGATGYLMKETGAHELLATIRSTFQGGNHHVSERMSLHLLSRMDGGSQQPPPPTLSRLSDRELQVFEYLGMGKNSGEIAQILSLSTRTVDGHRSQIRKKLKLEDGSSLEKKAIRWVECGEID